MVLFCCLIELVLQINYFFYCRQIEERIKSILKKAAELTEKYAKEIHDKKKEKYVQFFTSLHRDYVLRMTYDNE